MPVFPAVASMTVPPGLSLPVRSACSIKPMGARSFKVTDGFKYSGLAKISAGPGGASFFICSIGVSPTSFEISSLTRRRESEVINGTLQSKEREGEASMRRTAIRSCHPERSEGPRLARECVPGVGTPRFARDDTPNWILLRPRRRLGSGVITAFRANGKFAGAARSGIHFHLTLAALVFRSPRFVSDGVLGADIVGHAAADRVNFVQCLGEKSEAASSLGHDLQGAFGVLRVLFAFQDANGVNSRSAVALQTPHRLLERFGALVVLSVRNHKNDFLFELPFLFQVVSGGNDRIVERSAAASLDFFQPSFELIDVGSEILIKVVLVVEVDDEYLVVRI